MEMQSQETMSQPKMPRAFNFARTSLILAIIGIIVPLLILLILSTPIRWNIPAGQHQELVDYAIGILMLLSFIAVITANVLGIIALVKGKPGKGLAIAGIIISSAGAPLIFISLIAVAMYIVRIF